MSKAPIQAFADRVSAVFVPVVVALALATFTAWCAHACLRPVWACLLAVALATTRPAAP